MNISHGLRELMGLGGEILLTILVYVVFGLCAISPVIALYMLLGITFK